MASSNLHCVQCAERWLGLAACPHAPPQPRPQPQQSLPSLPQDGILPPSLKRRKLEDPVSQGQSAPASKRTSRLLHFVCMYLVIIIDTPSPLYSLYSRLTSTRVSKSTRTQVSLMDIHPSFFRTRR
ncbi:hypothetical protein K435DRAFT_344830 [Dendrothele bispora CBS 962.96]|uniref:Uncharacterized protein n=1 Tax=Dendrothele bispora (strain CBS 962.96) TaxID=1314807 RepID=A0A4S8MIG8_DENBC|nr:hypothetical protein K435DRAFT_344830 [Dendrothele bispora CBS 962.96]